MEVVSYWIEGHDEITWVSDSWAVFAMSNDAPSLTEHVVGHSLWEFVSDGATRQVYRDLLVRVRDGRTVTFSYRCDSPSLRRFMRMTMTPRAHDGVGFDSLTLGTEPRVAPTFLIHAGEQSDALLRVCSWCKRAAVADEWVEVEAAVERLGLFAGHSPFGITHGMCPECFARIMEEGDAA
jgi:hypothetical protein